MNIPLFKPVGGYEAYRALKEVFDGNWWGKGPKVAELENKLGEYWGISEKRVVATNSCTSALELALSMVPVAGKEVLVPAITFCATAHSVYRTGGKPVFVDIDKGDLCLDFDAAKKKINEKTAAMLFVHFGGFPWPGLDSWSGYWHIPIIQDCAHAMGAAIGGHKIGSSGTCAFSFHAVKNLACGGGALVFDAPEQADRARKLAWHGIDRGTYDRTAGQRYSWEYNIAEIGMKGHMEDPCAAVGLSQLRLLDEHNRQRNLIAAKYDKAFGRPPLPLDVHHSRHLYWLCHPNARNWERALNEHGVQTGLHYKPLNLYHIYGPYQPCPVAESLWKNLLTIPCWPGMTSEMTDFVIEIVRKEGV